MIESISLAARQQAAVRADADAGASSASVDFQNFLKLLTAQLRNQDPLSPLDSTQFVAQLASFSTVEQLVNANARLNDIAQGLGDGGLADFANWIGREAEISGGPVIYAGAPVPFRIEPDPRANHVVLVARDAAGHEISRATALNTADIQNWSGASQGAYFLSAEYYDGTQLIASRQASTFSIIEGVRLTSSGPILQLAGGAEAAPDDVLGLRQAI